MNYSISYLLKSFVFVFVFSLVLAGKISASAAAADKLPPAEVINKHLDSIGTLEDRAAVKTITIVGNCKATFFGRGGGQTEGIFVLASEDKKYLVGMKFNNADYQFEKFSYDGENFLVGFVKPGIRSILGNFLRTNETTFERSIIGGALFSSWELLRFNEKDAKLKNDGIKKIDGKSLYKLEYNPKKGSDLNISLYFDSETFRHVRTEYTRVLSAKQGAGVDASAGLSETRYKLTEEFLDFRQENKLTLPHTYKISLEIITGNGTNSSEWIMNAKQFNFNQPIDPRDFKVDSY